MEEEIQTRRREELEALHAFYGEQLLPRLPPQTNGEDNSEISTEGPWFIQLTMGSGKSNSFVPTLEIRLPPNYPLLSPNDEGPKPILHNVDYHMTSKQKQSLLEELREMYEPEMNLDVGILWAERCREEFVDVIGPSCVDAKEDVVETGNLTSGISEQQDEIELSIVFLSYNHLLHGKSHKKEAQVVSAASKMGLIGFVTYGTPGLIGIIVTKNDSSTNTAIGIISTQQDVVEFSKECSQIGKKCTILDIALDLDDNGLISKKDAIASSEKASKKKNYESQNKNSNGNQSNGLHPLLVDLLGAERVSLSKQNNNSTQLPSIQKKGLNFFMSCGDLKKVLVEKNGMDEKNFQQIIGVA